MIKEGIFYFDEREIHTGLWESVQERRTARIKAFDMGAGGKGGVANTEDTEQWRGLALRCSLWRHVENRLGVGSAVKQGGQWETMVVAFKVLRKDGIWAHLGSRPNRIWCQAGCGKSKAVKCDSRGLCLSCCPWGCIVLGQEGVEERGRFRADTGAFKHILGWLSHSQISMLWKHLKLQN